MVVQKKESGKAEYVLSGESGSGHGDVAIDPTPPPTAYNVYVYLLYLFTKYIRYLLNFYYLIPLNHN